MDEFGKKKKSFSLGETEKERRNNLIIIMLSALLIIVVVAMDFMAQVQNYMMSQQYDSLLKKANFK